MRHIIIRETRYAKRGKGSYLLFFRHDGRGLCIDATTEDDSYGRLINHGKKDANLVMKVFVVGDAPRVAFLASRDIAIGEEILYDYGEKRKDVLQNNPWLN